MLTDEEIKFLEEKALAVRRHIIRMIYTAQSGHPGGSLSATDILVTLYFKYLKHRWAEPNWSERDRFVLSKGHGVPALYAVLAECGYFPKEELLTLRKINSRLQGHPDARKLPGIEASTGSLGQGLSVACGMALAGKIDKKDYRVYALIGDGESESGQIWEAAMTAHHYKLDNLTVFLDRNNLQIDGCTENIMCLEPLSTKWEAAGWHVLEINGHNYREIGYAIEESWTVKEKPTMIIAKTIKGKGVSFMENNVSFHGKPPTKEEAERAMKELGDTL
ncbi:MAG: transketolase [Thermoplasmata archaeon]|nr:transketolase [Thermoplasmata archaeon]